MSVIALAGRRIDPPHSVSPQFPPEKISLVCDRLRCFFQTHAVSALVCSAACGADLLALEEASRLGIPVRIVLPFDPLRFRESSVTDRPGDWEAMYDRIVARAGSLGDIVVLAAEKTDAAAYLTANTAILNQAAAWAQRWHENVMAVLVWNGASNGKNDLTQAFALEARRLGFDVLELSTQ